MANIAYRSVIVGNIILSYTWGRQFVFIQYLLFQGVGAVISDHVGVTSAGNNICAVIL
ncbi:hypothetical protein D3C76_1659830 [compost metagenome]